MDAAIEVVEVDPRDASIRGMIEKLDLYMLDLYPAESVFSTSPEVLAAGGNRFFVAKVNGEQLGCGAVLIHENAYAEVKRIYVDPAARGRGLANEILHRLEQECRQLGLVEMKLETGIHQPDAIKLFERFGYAKCPAFGDYSPDDPYSYFMAKSL